MIKECQKLSHMMGVMYSYIHCHITRYHWSYQLTCCCPPVIDQFNNGLHMFWVSYPTYQRFYQYYHNSGGNMYSVIFIHIFLSQIIFWIKKNSTVFISLLEKRWRKKISCNLKIKWAVQRWMLIKAGFIKTHTLC